MLRDVQHIILCFTHSLYKLAQIEVRTNTDEKIQLKLAT